MAFIEEITSANPRRNAATIPARDAFAGWQIQEELINYSKKL